MVKTNYEVVKAWRKNNKDKVNEQARRYRAKHPETSRKAALKYRAKNLKMINEYEREYQRNRRLTPEYKAAQKIRTQRFKAKVRVEQERIAGRQCPELCELCNGVNGRIVFDHCHIKGHFRGWICDRCNRVLGSVKDDIILLELMIKYLENNNGEIINKEEKTIA